MAKKKERDWQEVTRQILDALDIRAEYVALGLKVDGGEPSKSGWLQAHAWGRDDRSTSAGINVGLGAGRGRYKDHGGSGLSCGLFEFAAHVGKFTDWKEARKYYAEQVGVKLGSGKRETTPDESLAWSDWNENLARAWCLKKKGCTSQSLRECGGKMASWPKESQQFHLIVLPVYGPDGTDADPIGWVAWNRTGGMLPIFQGKGVPPKLRKMKTIAGSKGGLMGRDALEYMATAEVVWKVEGPGDMVALNAIIPAELRGKHVVITNSSGANEIPQEWMLTPLVGKRVFVLHDADKPGQGIPRDGEREDLLSGSKRWAEEIARYAADTRNVQLPYEIDENHGKDVRDFINEGATYAKLLELAEATTPIISAKTLEQVGAESVASEKVAVESVVASETAKERAAATFFEERLCQDLMIDVLGELKNRAVKLFSIYHHKTEIFGDIGRVTYEQFMQFVGPPGKAKIHQSKEDLSSQGLYSYAQVKQAIGLLAGYRRIGDNDEVGLGVWRGKSDGGEHTNSVILVNAGQAARLNGDRVLRQIFVPRADGLLLELSGSDPWYEFKETAAAITKCYGDREYCHGVVNELINLLGRWRWKNQEIDPTLAAGLVLATWVQTFWSWRPLVAVIGPSNSGKTSAFLMLESLFGSLALKSSQSSEAGLRQALKHDAKAILCDEFEDSYHRSRILELFRTSGRGDKIFRGTGGQQGESYGLQHIAWVAAIEVGLKREPDRNRFITLELVRPEETEHGKLRIPSDEEMGVLGQKLLAVAITHVGPAVEMAVKLKAMHHDGVDKRVIESYAVPAAMLAVIMGFGLDQANVLLQQLLANVERADQGRADEADLMEDILSAMVDCGRGVKLSVAQILSSTTNYATASDSIEAHGICLGFSSAARRGHERASDAPALFICHRQAARMLLRGTPWEFQSIDQLLKRLPGAERDQRKLAGRNARGVSLPMDMVKTRFLNSVEQLVAVGTDEDGFS